MAGKRKIRSGSFKAKVAIAALREQETLANCLSFTVNVTCVFHDEELFRQTTCVKPTPAISSHK